MTRVGIAQKGISGMLSTVNASGILLRTWLQAAWGRRTTSTEQGA